MPAFSVEGMDQHPALAVVAALAGLLDDAGELGLLSISGGELDQLIEAELGLVSRLGAHVAAAVRQARTLDRAGGVAAPGMVAWLRGRFGLSAATASRLVRDSAGLDGAPVAAYAARAGAVPVESAVEIGHAVTALPVEVGPALRAEGDALLVGFATGRDGPVLDATQLRFLGRHLHEVLDPQTCDELLAARLDREDADVHRRRYLSVTDDPSGGVRLRGLLTAEAGATLRAVLRPLAAPASRSPNPPTIEPATGEPGDPTEFLIISQLPGDPDGAGSAGSEAPGPGGLPLQDERTAGQRLADALVDAAEHLLAHGGLPTTGGERPQLIVTVDHRTLLTGLGPSVTDDGTDLRVEDLRRLACDAVIVPAVLGTASQPLDLGRTARTATATQRRALTLRDGGCAFPGCDRPPSWCQAHHIRHWAILGPTDLANLVLLCGHHHRVLHRDSWHIDPPVDGIRPLFTPPPWIDTHQRPRRNHHHHLRDLLRAPS